MPAAKFTCSTPVICTVCKCLFSPVAYRPSRNKISHSPGRTTCSKSCYSEYMAALHRVPLEDRFWSKVDIKSESECWLWTASKTTFGHGCLGRRDGGTSVASRISYEIKYGPVPKELEVRHKCDVPACCNPSHLELGTHKQNMEDMSRRGRASHSEETKRKISESQSGKFLSVEHKKKLSLAKLGKPSSGAKSVDIDGVKFKSITEAAFALKCARKSIQKRIVSGAAGYV